MTDLGDLGGTGGIAGNHACAINNHGEWLVVRSYPTTSPFTDSSEQGGGDADLGTLPGDFASLAIDINNEGEVVFA